MATLREYFDSELSSNASIHKAWAIGDEQGNISHEVIAKIHQIFHANAKFWSFFIESGTILPGTIDALFTSREVSNCVLSSDGDEAILELGSFDYSKKMTSTTLEFTKRIYMYIDELLTASDRAEIEEYGTRFGYSVIVRDKEYALKRSELEKPLAFISHDSRDKDSIVRQLVHELAIIMCPVWFDEYSLNVGDSLRSSIETGLKETKKCIVILSPNFLGNDGWGKAEFDSIYTREMIEKNNVILPVWHNVSAQDVFDYSPRLADKYGLNSSIGIKELAKKLAFVIKNS